jgi:hypothetical protein
MYKRIRDTKVTVTPDREFYHTPAFGRGTAESFMESIDPEGAAHIRREVQRGEMPHDIVHRMVENFPNKKNNIVYCQNAERYAFDLIQRGWGYVEVLNGVEERLTDTIEAAVEAGESPHDIANAVVLRHPLPGLHRMVRIYAEGVK